MHTEIFRQNLSIGDNGQLVISKKQHVNKLSITKVSYTITLYNLQSVQCLT